MHTASEPLLIGNALQKSAGELSWLNLVFPQVVFLVPLVRFPGFIWLIAVGFALPKTISQSLQRE
ncbi:MAG: hypothetical protein ACR2IV_22225 [Bryobacteraceae bacterium]